MFNIFTTKSNKVKRNSKLLTKLESSSLTVEERTKLMIEWCDNNNKDTISNILSSELTAYLSLIGTAKDTSEFIEDIFSEITKKEKDDK